MDIQEKTLARKLFKLQIHEAAGQKFEDIFTAIMNYAEPDFQPIKPWGNIGDRKSDGYIKSKGIFFQVYSPEDIKKSYVHVVNKLEKDFHGLLKFWNPVNEFYFVVNDKNNGVNADCENKIQAIKQTHSLRRAGFLTPKDLENILFDLADDQILSVINYLPDPAKIKILDYSILNEVISHIMGLSLAQANDSGIILPDWDDKIAFNQLTNLPSSYLNNGYLQIGGLDKYLKNNGNFLADELKRQMREIYVSKTMEGKFGDDLFWSIANEASPRNEAYFMSSVIVIMAKYFETCDIFKNPEKES